FLGPSSPIAGRSTYRNHHDSKAAMNNEVPKTAQRRVVENYFRTTSATAASQDRAKFERDVLGLRRRLGSWCDVSGKDIVDLGCGTGELCFLADRLGARSIIGVNLSQDEIDFASQRVKCQFAREDIVTFLEKCPAESFDRVFALNIL